MVDSASSTDTTIRSRYKFLDTKIDLLTSEDMLKVLSRYIDEKRQCILASQNLHGLYVSSRDDSVRLLHAMPETFVHIDGMPLVAVCRLFGIPARRDHRVTLVDFADPLLCLASEQGWRVFYLGSSEDVLGAALASIKARFPNLRLSAVHGYFDEAADSDSVAETIRAFQPDLILVGMGMGRQERFILSQRNALAPASIFTVGAMMEYLGGAVATPPRWMGRCGLEWSFRFFRDPRRFWFRYLIEPVPVATVIIRFLVSHIVQNIASTTRSTPAQAGDVSKSVLGRRIAFMSGAPRASTKAITTVPGPRQHMLGTIAGFEANGCDVERYIVGDRVPETWLLESSPLKSSQVSVLKLLVADLVRIFSSIYHSIAAQRTLARPDWVYERYGAFQALGYLFQRRGALWILETNAPLFIEASRDVKSVYLSAALRICERWAYQQCDVLVVVSESLRDLIVDRLKVPARKILVVPNAADLQTFDPETTPSRRLFDQDTFIVGFEGSMYEWAGLELLVRAVAALRERGRNVAAVLVGDGIERAALQELTVRLGVSEFICFTGRVRPDEVPEFILGFDVGYSGQIMLSTNSMYLSPLKLYDYMAMGKPVVASRFADAIKLVGRQECGFLFEPGSFNELKSALELAMDNREQLENMGAAARSNVLMHHSWTARIRELVTHVETTCVRERSS